MLYQKLQHSGAHQFSTLINGILITRTYYFTSKKESKKLFIEEMRGEA